ncbi:carboxypeptidase-like regulatory domain-containing protein [Lutibacter aestuarii]|uniref:Carboxypeptidase-like regulatory domain-containing protein n=1 Tax=Lutibacter aestuarii TaxID=861111 RepID=A0ABW2Z462_9FLAO|nr:carboxypeptidase-like regulatory domain-containing protein [uncultured Lutibacter sp.]
MKKCFILFTLFFISFINYAQTISGTIYNKTTNEVLPGASIYLNGTTIGDVSDFNGYFELNLAKITNTPLIISYTGFKTILIASKDLSKKLKIYLEEETQQLNEVIISPDKWSRKKKLQIFKNEFLGTSENAKYCTIENEKDIQLMYNDATKTLSAYCNQPIIIKNKFLGYQINYNLTEFEVKFHTSLNGFRLIKSVYNEGYSFFKNLRKKVTSKTIKNRKKAYNGSSIHFMKSLANKRLTENKFEIYYKSWPTLPYKYFTLHTQNGLTKVNVNVESLDILYNKTDQSKIQFQLKNGSGVFYIDKNGNHMPPKAISWAGNLSLKRISDMLPLDYDLTKKQ